MLHLKMKNSILVKPSKPNAEVKTRFRKLGGGGLEKNPNKQFSKQKCFERFSVKGICVQIVNTVSSVFCFSSKGIS